MITQILWALAPLFVQMLLLSMVGSMVNRATLRLFGKFFYFLLMWPGVVVHELSHLIGCVITRTKVHRVHFFSPQQEGSTMVLGYVEHDRPRNPLAQMIVSGAPFFGGATAILMTMYFFLPLTTPLTLSPIMVTTPDFLGFIRAFVHAFEGYAQVMFAVAGTLDWFSWKSYAFLYVLFSLAAHVAPSRTDLVHALQGAALLGMLLIAVQWFATRFSQPLALTFVSWIAHASGALTVLLGYGLAILLCAALLLGTITLFVRRQ